MRIYNVEAFWLQPNDVKLMMNMPLSGPCPCVGSNQQTRDKKSSTLPLDYRAPDEQLNIISKN